MVTLWQQQSLDFSTLEVPPSKVSLDVSDEEDYNSLSDDEGLHRSYRASQTSLHASAPVKQKNKFYKNKFLNRLMRLGKKGDKELQERQIQDPCFDVASGAPDEKSGTDDQHQKTNSTTAVKPSPTPSIKPKEEEVTENGKPNGTTPRIEGIATKTTPKDNDVRDALKRNQEKARTLSAESRGFPNYSQASTRPSPSGSRLLGSGISDELGRRRKVKVILLGDPGVGKSTFLQTLTTGEFVPSNKLSNIVSAQTSFILTHSGQEVELEVQDTAGQERFRSLTASYYRHAHGCFVFFNVHDKDSFASVSSWLEDISIYHSNTVTPAVVLVGLLHRPPKDRQSVRRRSSLRGDDIQAFNSASLSPNKHTSQHLSGGGSSSRRGSAQDIYKHQVHPNEHHHQHHSSPNGLHTPHNLLTIPAITVELPMDDLREVPRAQAEHMAALWEIPYMEVDARFDNDSVLHSVETLLDLVIPDLAEITRSRLSSIVPPSSRKSSLNWSQNCADRVNSFTCCLHC